jgi:Ran-binding protein 3
MTSNKSTFGASPFGTSSASTGGFGAPGFGSAFAGTSGKLTSFASPNAPTSFSGTAVKLSSFASPNAPASFGDSKDKILGATQPDNEESDKEADGETNDTFVAEKTDERFHEKTGRSPSLLPDPKDPILERYSSLRDPTVETGEENETTEFMAKGKLYYFDDKKWKERGAGTFKVNSKLGGDGKFSARMIMRADGAHRVMLNSALWSTMPFGVKGQRPASRDIYLASKEDDKVSTLLLRVSPLFLTLLLKVMSLTDNIARQR